MDFGALSPLVAGGGGAPSVPLWCGRFGVLRGWGWRPPSAPVAAWEGTRGRALAKIGRYLGQRRGVVHPCWHGFRCPFTPCGWRRQRPQRALAVRWVWCAERPGVASPLGSCHSMGWCKRVCLGQDRTLSLAKEESSAPLPAWISVPFHPLWLAEAAPPACPCDAVGLVC